MECSCVRTDINLLCQVTEDYL